MRTIPWSLPLPIVVLLVFALAASAAAADGTNATPTKQPGVYFVMPVLQQVTSVQVVPLNDAGKREKRSLERKDCKYDATTGKLEVKVPIDDKAEMICVIGDPVVPWAWHLPEGVVLASVRVLLRDKEAKLHEDFEIDATQRQIRFVKRQDCDRGTNYLIVYELVPDPKRPNERVSGSFGNHRDQEAVGRFLKAGSEAKASRPKDSKGQS